MRDKTRIIETLVGIAVISIFVICLVIIYRSANPRMDANRNYYSLRAIFDRADGINLGSDVMISGVKVGSVSAIELDESNYTALVTLTLANKVKVPVDSSAEIVSFSLLGDKYVNIVTGSESEFLNKGETFEFTQSAISIEQLLSKMLFGLDSNAANKEEAKEENVAVD
jgi:phospholipid/cholesterol/gamma-HCH transport system substrate-binding protein